MSMLTYPAGQEISLHIHPYFLHGNCECSDGMCAIVQAHLNLCCVISTKISYAGLYDS